jgi:T5SS/PEP-CTERM-associated repeat protein
VTVRGEGNYVVDKTRFKSPMDANDPNARCTVSFVLTNWDSSGTGKDGSGLFDVGVYGGGAIVKVLAGSQVKADYVRVGENEGSQGNLLVSGAGSYLQGISGMQVGAGGWGEFVMDMGAKADLSAMYLANFGPLGIGNAVISDPGTVLNVLAVTPYGDHRGGSGELVVGSEGQAHMIVGNEATVNATSLTVGEASTATADLLVENANTSFHVTGDAEVGGTGVGLLTIADKATFMAGNIVVGSVGSGSMVIDGATGQAYDSTYVGVSGIGNLRLKGSATLETANLVAGQSSGGTGTIEVTGTGTEMRVTSDIFRVGDKGAGEMNITEGGKVMAVEHVIGESASAGGMAAAAAPTSSAWVVIGEQAGASGTITVGGAGSVLDVPRAPVTAGAFGSGILRVTSGGTVSMGDGELWVGQETGATGTVEVTGANAQLWEQSSNFSEIGTRGTGTLTVSNGGMAQLSQVMAGVENGSSGAVNVSGENSALIVVNELVVGNVGTGTLAISDKGTASCGILRVGMADGATGGRGTVTLTGMGSALTVNQENIWVGYTGRGVLTVGAGTAVSATNGNLFVGGFSGSEGEVTVDGKGAEITALVPAEDDYGSWVGREGVGRLTISNGGYVKVSRLSVGEQASGEGFVTITTGAALEVVHDIQLGSAGRGEIHLAGGRLILGDQILIVGEHGKITGTGTIEGGMLNDSGLVTPGDTGDLMTVNYYGQQGTALLKFVLAGWERGVSYDAMDVLARGETMGNVDLFDGTLEIDVASGFIPAAGDIFNLIDAASDILMDPKVKIEMNGLPEGLGYQVHVVQDAGLGMNVLQLSIEAVPEPGSLALLGMGAAGLMRRRRRK